MLGVVSSGCLLVCDVSVVDVLTRYDKGFSVTQPIKECLIENVRMRKKESRSRLL